MGTFSKTTVLAEVRDLRKENATLRDRCSSLEVRSKRHEEIRRLVEAEENRVRSILFWVRDHVPGEVGDYIDRRINRGRYEMAWMSKEEVLGLQRASVKAVEMAAKSRGETDRMIEAIGEMSAATVGALAEVVRELKMVKEELVAVKGGETNAEQT